MLRTSPAPVADPATVAGRSTGWDAALRRHAHLCPDRTAVVMPGVARRSWRELDERVERLAAALAQRGVAAGDRVVLLMGNCVEYVESLVACGRIGAVAVPVNFRLVAAEVEYLIVDSGARAVIVDQARATAAAAARVSAGSVDGPCLVVADPTSAGRVAAAGPNAEGYEDALAAAHGVAAPSVAAEASDAAVILYTSGTTGRPKGAVLTHHNLAMQAMTIFWSWRLHGGDDVVLCAVPLFHVAGVSGVAPNILVGATTVVLPSGTFDAGEVVDVLERFGVTAVFLVPTQWAAVCAVPDLGSRRLALRCMSWGAAPATPELLRRMAETFPGVTNLALFGQTEMSPVTCVLAGEDATRKIGSVGQPVPWVDMRVVDDVNTDVAPGVIGEIVYRGPTLMAGYWNQPEATAAAMEGGWFHSGDLVRQDKEGFVYVVDRKKDMIISGGENIYSTEIEVAIDAHPAVAEVAVVGVPHPKWGETPVAVVVATDSKRPPTFEELTEWTRARLAAYKRPRAAVVVDALPRNAGGKVLKVDLRSRYRSLFAEETEGK